MVLKRRVPVHYRLHGKNQVTFSLASYDRHQPLVIDPILSYSTYLGGSSIDVPRASRLLLTARRSSPVEPSLPIFPRRIPYSPMLVGLTTFPKTRL